MAKPNKSGKYRVTVSLSEKMFNRISKDADNLGLSPGVFLNQIIANHYSQLDANKDTATKALIQSFSKYFEESGLSQEFIQNVTSESIEDAAEDLNKILFKK